MRTVPLQVILPVDKFTFGQPEREEKPFKTLYLLHGIFGNETDWVHGTRIQRWAEEKTLPLSCRPARMRFMWISRPSVPCTDSLSEKNWLRLQENVSTVQKKRRHLYRRSFHGWFWRTQKWPEISRYLRGCDLPVRCTSCAGKSGREQSGQLLHMKKVISGNLVEAAKSDKNPGCSYRAVKGSTEKRSVCQCADRIPGVRNRGRTSGSKPSLP